MRSRETPAVAIGAHAPYGRETNGFSGPGSSADYGPVGIHTHQVNMVMVDGHVTHVRQQYTFNPSFRRVWTRIGD